MKVTAHTRRVLAFRRQERLLRRFGYEYLEPWRLARGDQYRGRIVHAVIATDGKRIYYKVEEADPSRNRPSVPILGQS